VLLYFKFINFSILPQIKLHFTVSGLGVCGGAVGWSTALQARRLRFLFPMRSLHIYHWLLIFPTAPWPGSRVSL